MAITLTTAGVQVDAVMSASMKNSGFGGLSPVLNLKETYWLQPAAVGDTFTITDGNGRVIRTGQCEVAGQSQIFCEASIGGVLDFQVTVLSSGVLYIRFIG